MAVFQSNSFFGFLFPKKRSTEQVSTIQATADSTSKSIPDPVRADMTKSINAIWYLQFELPVILFKNVVMISIESRKGSGGQQERPRR